MNIKKFRVWDLEYKEWTNPRDFINHLWKVTHLTKAVILDSGHQSEYKICMFTGLMDKNNREIFEGDICKVTGGWSGSVDKQPMFNLDCHHFWEEVEENIEKGAVYEIIGNIY